MGGGGALEEVLLSRGTVGGGGALEEVVELLDDPAEEREAETTSGA